MGRYREWYLILPHFSRLRFTVNEFQAASHLVGPLSLVHNSPFHRNTVSSVSWVEEKETDIKGIVKQRERDQGAPLCELIQCNASRRRGDGSGGGGERAGCFLVAPSPFPRKCFRNKRQIRPPPCIINNAILHKIAEIAKIARRYGRRPTCFGAEPSSVPT